MMLTRALSRRYFLSKNILFVRNVCNLSSALHRSKTHEKVGLVRFYSTKDRSSEQKYKHGKLIEDKLEDPTRYPHFLMIFSSTDQAVLDGYTQFVKKAANMVDVNLTKTFNMPATEETYKAKREGKGLVSEMVYNLKRHQRVVEIQDLTGEKSDIFMDYLQRKMPAGVNVEIQLKQWEKLVEPNHIMFRES